MLTQFQKDYLDDKLTSLTYSFLSTNRLLINDKFNNPSDQSLLGEALLHLSDLFNSLSIEDLARNKIPQECQETYIIKSLVVANYLTMLAKENNIAFPSQD